jgi:ribosomal protein S4E
LSDNKSYKVGDTLLIEMPAMKASNHFKLEKGALVYITAGTNVGKVGVMESTKSFKGGQPDNIVISTKNGTIETRKEYALVIGHGKSAISIE